MSFVFDPKGTFPGYEKKIPDEAVYARLPGLSILMRIPGFDLLHEVLSPLGDIYACKHGAVIINDEEESRKRNDNNYPPSNVHETRIAVHRSVDGAWCSSAVLFQRLSPAHGRLSFLRIEGKCERLCGMLELRVSGGRDPDILGKR